MSIVNLRWLNTHKKSFDSLLNALSKHNRGLHKCNKVPSIAFHSLLNNWRSTCWTAWVIRKDPQALKTEVITILFLDSLHCALMMRYGGLWMKREGKNWSVNSVIMAGRSWYWFLSDSQMDSVRGQVTLLNWKDFIINTLEAFSVSVPLSMKTQRWKGSEDLQGMLRGCSIQS